MSGHSKWENIKRRKGSQDQKRGKVFSKLSRLIAIAVKESGSSDVSANPKLRALVDQARAANMPKVNIQRALLSGKKDKNKRDEFIIEGYGPEKVAVLLSVETDNRQRVVQEIKSVFRRHDGRLAEPGSVSFQFSRLGMVVLAKTDPNDVLSLMDAPGVVDFQDGGGRVVFYLQAKEVEGFKSKAKEKKLKIISSQIIMKPASFLSIDEDDKRSKISDFLRDLRNCDDVLHLFSNFSEDKNE